MNMNFPLSFHLLLLAFCLISSFASGATLLEEEGSYLICLLVNYYHDKNITISKRLPIGKE